MKKLISFFAVVLILISSPLAFSQTVTSNGYAIQAQNRIVNSNWWITIPLYLNGAVGQSIEGLDVTITYPSPLQYQYGEYVATWNFPSDWWYSGAYVSASQDTMHFALMGGSFSFSQIYLGTFPLHISNLPQGQTVRLGISARVAENIGGKDTLIYVHYSGGYITGGPNVLPGDADGDGQYTLLDPLKILEIATSQSPASAIDSLRSDVSGDGYITSWDAYEVLMRTVYPYWTFEVLQGNYSGAKGSTVQVPGTKTPIAIQLTETNGGVEVSLPDSVSISCADLSFSSAVEVDRNISQNGMFETNSNGNQISLIAKGGSIGGQIGFIPNTRAKDVVVKGTVDNGTRITVVDQTVTAVTNRSSAPKDFSLAQNYPNPFNPATKISYAVPKTSKVLLKVYDLLGREVATLVDGFVSAGQHEAIFNGLSLPSGMYLYRLQAGSFSKTEKMILIK